jgi:hypothetical protein
MLSNINGLKINSSFATGLRPHIRWTPYSNGYFLEDEKWKGKRSRIIKGPNFVVVLRSRSKSHTPT